MLPPREAGACWSYLKTPPACKRWGFLYARICERSFAFLRIGPGSGIGFRRFKASGRPPPATRVRASRPIGIGRPLSLAPIVSSTSVVHSPVKLLRRAWNHETRNLPTKPFSEHREIRQNPRGRKIPLELKLTRFCSKEFIHGLFS